MKASELQKQIRIGNYLLGKCEDELEERKVYWEIYQIKDAEDLMGVKMDWDKPIELTEEWLLKMGFELFTQQKNYPLFFYKGNSYNRSLSVSIHSDFCRVNVVNQEITTLKYVHQLQNVFHALTGEELELKETL